MYCGQEFIADNLHVVVVTLDWSAGGRHWQGSIQTEAQEAYKCRYEILLSPASLNSWCFSLKLECNNFGFRV